MASRPVVVVDTREPEGHAYTFSSRVTTIRAKLDVQSPF